MWPCYNHTMQQQTATRRFVPPTWAQYQAATDWCQRRGFSTLDQVAAYAFRGTIRKPYSRRDVSRMLRWLRRFGR